MVKASTVRFTFGRYDQYEFVHHGQLTEHPTKDRLVHACRTCGDPCTGQAQYYCSPSCRDAWYKDVTAMTKWRYWRRKALQRDDYTCQRCGYEGSRRAYPNERRMTVDHIKPVKTHPSLEYDLDNLRTLCEPCHKERHRGDHARPIPTEEDQSLEAFTDG